MARVAIGIDQLDRLDRVGVVSALSADPAKTFSPKRSAVERTSFWRSASPSRGSCSWRPPDCRVGDLGAHPTDNLGDAMGNRRRQRSAWHE